jgi:bifunctional enzyme CysN/CysC
MTAQRAIQRAEAEVLPKRPVKETPKPVLAQELSGMIHILTCGSVDDGKSTLIGRLLWDATDLYDDQRETLSRGRTVDGGNPDFSLLMDGLVAEREQGITIDIAWRYFDTEHRRFVVIDSPGHEQYTRNMASGASHADVAIMLIDARHGVKRQTRRHAAILDLMGVKRVILAVNKMDLVDWSETRFREIEADFRKLCLRFDFLEALTIPVAAVSGDNVARKSERMPWYTGPHLLQHLEEMPSRGSHAAGPFRMPVQTVVRDGRDFRGFAGTVSSGTVHLGDTIFDVLSTRSAKVKRISTMDGDLKQAIQGQAVAIQLDIDLDISRGAVLSAPATHPTPARSIETKLVWLSERGFDVDTGYLLRTATDLVPISGIEIKARLDLETMVQHPIAQCGVNDIAIAHIDLGRPTAIDPFANAPETGCFMLVDAISGASVAGGVVTAASAVAGKSEEDIFILTRAMLERGVCADLKDVPGSEEEFRRRANEVALILRSAGVAVKIEGPQDFQI